LRENRGDKSLFYNTNKYNPRYNPRCNLQMMNLSGRNAILGAEEI
jgi:hypothetical protein